MARYSLKHKTFIKKGHGTLLVLPLTIITLFCFGFVLMHSESSKPASAASSRKTGRSDSTSTLPQTDSTQASEMQTVPDSSSQQQSGTTSSSQNSQSSTSTDHGKKTDDLTTKARNLINKN